MAERKPFYWLNEDSRVFLERGYLSEGETPEQRIKDIANKAEEILGVDGFADKFYDYIGKGFYSLSSPVWANFGKDRGMSISCFGSYIDDNISSADISKYIRLRWLHKFENGDIQVVNESSKLSDYDIRWYRYELGAPSADEYSGVYWESVDDGNSN